MDALQIEGGRPLHGEVEISGAKNAALPILMGSVLLEEEADLFNLPELRDVTTTRRILEGLGVAMEPIRRNRQKGLRICPRNLRKTEVPYDLVKTMRASVLLLGPLLARFQTAKVSLPGGCAIGARPINFHLEALERMGAKIHLEEGYVIAEVKKLKGAEYRFPEKTVTGTENILMAATLAEGTTVLSNAAQEPEIVDLADFLNRAGARIEGAGTETITIHGVSGLKGCTHSIMPDRIEAGTFVVAAAVTKGDLLLRGVDEGMLAAVSTAVRKAGVQMEMTAEGLRVRGASKIQAVDIETSPFPGFATDMQAQFMVLMALSEGRSVITETIFENRFMHVSELLRMGAEIRIDNNQAIVTGVRELKGARLMATDLRASASLVLAGLAASGKTRVSRVYHLDRGYERLERKLRGVGAKIRRLSE